MGYLLNEDQQAIVSSVKAFMEKEVAPVCAECDRSGELPMTRRWRWGCTAWRFRKSLAAAASTI